MAGAVLSAGCGGSGQNATASEAEAPLTKAEFIKKADAICRKADNTQYREATAYSKAHEKELERLSPIPREERLIVAVVLPSVLKEAEEIEAIGAPKGEAGTIKTFIAAIEKGVKKAEKHPYTVEYEIPSEDPFSRAVDLAREYGFNECTAVT